MAVKIRLSRKGKKHVPFYTIVAVDERKKRDGAYLENLGTYDALKSTVVSLNQDRVDYWLSVGAVQSDAFERINKSHKKASSPKVTASSSKKKSKAAEVAKED